MQQPFFLISPDSLFGIELCTAEFVMLFGTNLDVSFVVFPPISEPYQAAIDRDSRRPSEKR